MQQRNSKIRLYAYKLRVISCDFIAMMKVSVFSRTAEYLLLDDLTTLSHNNNLIMYN